MISMIQCGPIVNHRTCFVALLNVLSMKEAIDDTRYYECVLSDGKDIEYNFI